MDIAMQLVLALKENNKSHVGYGLQNESQALISHILQNMAKSRLPPFKIEKKNKDDSLRFREEGNQRFVSGEDAEAIESYTMSLAYADSHELMAYAHANRSAALYRKRFYKECLMDIDAALSLGYPEEKKKKLKERGDKALEEIKKNLNSESDQEVTKFSSNMKNKIDVSDPFQSEGTTGSSRRFPLVTKVEAEELTKESVVEDDVTRELYSSPDAAVSSKPRYLADEGPPVVAYGPSIEAPAASNGVSISFSEKFGRHLIATKEFRPGEIIAVEDPYVSVLYQERYYTHCHYCLLKCYNLIPCTYCPKAQYCSEECRKIDWQRAHETECVILALLSSLLNIDKDKMRILTKIMKLLIVVTSNGKKIQQLREDMGIAESNSDFRTAGFTDAGIFESTSARSALSLATNMTTRPLIGISAFACISALGAILLATQTNFFRIKYEIEQLKDISKIPDIAFCGAVMLRACVIMSSNCFSVQQEPGIKSGSGLFVLHSLQNHSCSPNTFRHFHGITMITRALEPIRPGDQIFTSYGADHAYMPRPERKKKILEEYFFDCQCPACSNDWPTYRSILQSHQGSIASNKQLVMKLKPLKQRLLKNKYDIDAVKRVLEILYVETTKPCEEIVHAVQFLKSYYFDP